MCLSLLSMYFTLPIRVVLYAGITFVLIIFWAFRYPGSEKEYDERIKNGQKIGWFK